MKLTFLGTGTSQGIPVIGCRCEVCTSNDSKDKRLRCAALVSMEGYQILIDSGPDIRQQLLREEIDQVQAVLISHEHYDHTGGLDDLRPIIFSRDVPMDIYSLPYVLDTIRKKVDYAFGESKYPGAPKFHLISCFPGQKINLGPLKIIPLDIGHGELNILGFLFNQRLAYITDANRIPDLTVEVLKNIDTLIISTLHHTPHHSHFTFSESLDAIVKINPRQAFLIHMSHHLGKHESIQKTLPPNICLAYDQLTIEI